MDDLSICKWANCRGLGPSAYPACPPGPGGMNPIDGIVALFQSVGIKTGNLAVGRQVGGCAKNGSTALSGNKGIGIVEKDRASTLPAFIIDKFAFPVFFP